MAKAEKPLLIVSAEQARRVFMGAQGLLDDPVRQASAAAVRRIIEQLGFVQIDSINAVERAHHLTLRARLEGYRPAMLARLLERERSLFEHWTHDASAIPAKWFAHWHHRFARYRRRDPNQGWWKVRMGPNPRRVIAAVLRRIEREGPLMSKDFEGPRHGNDGPDVQDKWWRWKPEKTALEYLWRCGELAVARRVNFHKVYDLTGRVLGEAARQPTPTLQEHIDWACTTALARLGAATPGELAAFWRAINPAQAATWCRAAVRRGDVIQVIIEGANGVKPWKAIALPDLEQRARSLRDPPRQIRLLNPFDPLVRDRRRLGRLFGFDFTFEAFVPAAKRRWGYYVLPVLEGDRFVGRVHPRMDREAGTLIIQGAWWEPNIRVTKQRKAGLDAALARLADWLGADRVA